MTDLTAPEAFEWSNEPWGRALRCTRLDRTARHLFSTRDLLLEPIGDPGGEGWAALGRSMGVPHGSVLRLRQVHGARAVIVRAGDDDRDWDKLPPEADILVSDHPAVALSVRVADCVPILLADVRSGAAAAVHAGWRGTAAGAVRAAVDALAFEFGSARSDLVVAIGPSIGPCCYRVGADMVEAFRAAGATRDQLSRWFLAEPSRPLATVPERRSAEGEIEAGWELAASDFRLPTPDQLTGFSGRGGPGHGGAEPIGPGHGGAEPIGPGHGGAGSGGSTHGVSAGNETWADLWTATVDQLVEAGVPPGNIHLARLCTACLPTLFHSYRRDHTSLRTVGVIRAGTPRA